MSWLVVHQLGPRPWPAAAVGWAGLAFERRLPPTALARLLPGLPADVCVTTTERPSPEHLLEPLIPFFNRALREP